MPAKTHGKSNDAVYRTWKKIKQRTRNHKDPSYHKYGAKGTNICDEWFNSFPAFFAYIGDRPDDKATIERIENSKGYEPGNVKWATYKEQGNNRTSNRVLTIDGVSITVSQWSDKTGVPYRAILARLRIGWNQKDAVNLPVSKIRYRNRTDKESE